MTHGQLTKKLAKYGLYSPIARVLKISLQGYNQGVRHLKNPRYIEIGEAAVAAVENDGLKGDAAAIAAVAEVNKKEAQAKKLAGRAS